MAKCKASTGSAVKGLKSQRYVWCSPTICTH